MTGRGASGWGMKGLGILVLLATGCSGGTGIEEDPAVAPFVGDWDATSLILENVADPSVAPDLVVQVGATFFLNVQPSGTYTATLTFLGTPQTEIGRMAVSGNTVTQTPSFPPGSPVTVGTFEFPDSDTLILQSQTEIDFDFNNDMVDERALARFVLAKVGG